MGKQDSVVFLLKIEKEMAKKYQTKRYEDYEPISNLGVCSALLIVLASSCYLGLFGAQNSLEKESEVPKQTIQKVSSQSVNLQKKDNGCRLKED